MSALRSSARAFAQISRKSVQLPSRVGPSAAFLGRSQPVFRRGYAGEADDKGRARDAAAVGVSLTRLIMSLDGGKADRGSHSLGKRLQCSSLPVSDYISTLNQKRQKYKLEEVSPFINIMTGVPSYVAQLILISKGEETATKSIGKPQIGGPFLLTNQDNQPFTEKDLLGKWTLIYFGFTHCPDICPEELDKMGEAVERVDKERAERILPLFVSVDPARDTVEQVKKYVAGKYIHPEPKKMGSEEMRCRGNSRVKGLS